MSTFQDTFTDATNLSSTIGSEVVSGELRPLDHDDLTTLTFNGTTQYGQAVGYKGVTGSSACTIMGWFKTTETDSDNTLIYWGTGSTFARRWLRLEAGVLWDRLVTDTVSGGSNLGDGQWHHFAMVNPASVSTSQFLIYIDGISVTVATTTSGGTINIISGDDVYVGALAGSSNYFKGSLDDFRLYNTVLTADQIFSLVHAGIEPPTTNLQAHWLFNEGSGSSVNDETVNNRDLTLTGSPTWTTTHKPFYANRSLSTSTQIVTNQASISDFDFTVSKRSAGTIGRFQFSDDGSTWVNANGNSLTGYGSYLFDGVNDQITCGSDTSIDNIFSGGGTVMFWVFARSYGEGDLGRILHKGDPGGNLNSTQVLFYVGGIGIYRDFSTTDGIWSTTDPFPLNRWVHVAITYNDATTITIYLDGVSVPVTTRTSPVGSAVTDAAYNLTIGSWNGATRWFDGYLSDIRVYKGDILSSATIFDYYANATEPSETLDAHWKFNGNALDETANNNDGTVSGATNKTDFEFTPPIGNYDLSSGSVLSFDGTNDSVSIADNNVFSFGNGSTDSPFSVSAWTYMHDATNFRIICKDDASSNREWVFHVSGGDLLQFVCYDNSTGATIGRSTSAVTHLENQWLHVAATYDGSSNESGVEIYINGNVCDVNSQSSGSYTAMENTTQQVQIGARASDYANGLIANVAIWSDVRTQAEIIAEVENGYVETGNANLVAYYPLDGDADDYLGNYNGSISGATTATNYKRPAIVAPSQTTIDISGLSFTDLYYRYLTESNQAEFTTALTEISATYLTVQNIVVKDNGGTTIADGETTPQDFGATDQGEASPSLTFTIQNTGEATLTISSINLPSGYSISGSTPTTIAGSSSDTFTVILSTATAGTFSGDIEVNSDDPDTAVYNFAITGEISPIPPNLVIKDSGGLTIVDGETEPQIFTNVILNGTPTTLTFTLENTNNALLTISSITVPSGYSIVGSAPTTVAALSSEDLTVQLNSTTVGTFTGDITVNSDDPDTAVYNFAIYGEVTAVINLCQDFVWTTNSTEDILFTYRVESECGLEFDCIPDSDQSCSISAFGQTSNGQQLIINVIASSVQDVCQQLTERGFSFPILSIKKFKIPPLRSQREALEAQGEDFSGCNTLEDVSIDDLDCSEFTVSEADGTDSTVIVEAIATMEFIYEFTGSGTITVSSDSSFVFPAITYVGSGTITISGGSTVTSSGDLGILTSTVSAIPSAEITSVTFGEISGLTAGDLTDEINPGCGCEPLPRVLQFTHNLNSQSNLLDLFLRRNGFTLPSRELMIYNRNNRAWVYDSFYEGYSTFGDYLEDWRIKFLWSCTTELGPYSLGLDSTWEFTLDVRRKVSSLDKTFRTKVIVSMVPELICQGTKGLEFSFSLNTQTNDIVADRNVTANFKSCYDGCNLFTPWKNFPNFDFSVTQLIGNVETSTLDIGPLFPEKEEITS